MSVPTWPEHPQSRLLPKYIDWVRAHPDCVNTITVGMAAQLPPIAVESLFNRHQHILDAFPPDVQAALTARREGRPISTTTLIPVKITSLTRRMEELEGVRSSIPVEACLKMLLSAASTGELDGCILQAKERIDVLKYLVGRVLPDPKSLDMVERNVNLDRVRRSTKDATKTELAKLSKQELLDLMEGDE